MSRLRVLALGGVAVGVALRVVLSAVVGMTAEESQAVALAKTLSFDPHHPSLVYWGQGLGMAGLYLLALAHAVFGDHLVLLANAGYHGAAPALDRVIFKYIPDLTVLYTRFKAGAVDVTGLQGISAEFYAEAKSLPGVTVHLHYTPAVEYVYVNHGNPKFKELAVRQALYHAMDKRAIIDQVYYGLPKAVEGYLPATSWASLKGMPFLTR